MSRLSVEGAADAPAAVASASTIHTAITNPALGTTFVTSMRRHGVKTGGGARDEVRP